MLVFCPMRVRRPPRSHLETMCAREGWSEEEIPILVTLMTELLERPSPDDTLFPRYDDLAAETLAHAARRRAEACMESFLQLYAHLHMHEAQYTTKERARMDLTGGYWGHAGGLSPILRAGPWIQPDSISIDLGAGNGLQGLLLQLLHPHRLSIQIEISSRMVLIGRRVQRWLGIPEARVAWGVGDVSDVRLRGIDFVYLYRPLRPEGPAGQAFYRQIADDLGHGRGPATVFSVADCLGPFLPPSFTRIASDGHLTCFHRPGSSI